MAGTVRKRSWTTRKGEEKAAWIAAYTDRNKKPRIKTFATKKAADAWLLKTRGEVRDGTHTPDSASLTVAQAGEMFLQRCAADELERGSIRAYEQLLRLCINPEIGALRLSRLTTPRVEEFRTALLGNPKVGRPRAQRALSLLKTVIGYAQKTGQVAQNVALPVRIEKRKRLEEKLTIGRTIPTPAEVRAMLARAPEGWAGVMLFMAAFTGLRESELRGLHWEDVNFETREINVRQRADQWGTLGPSKTSAGHRRVTMSEEVMRELRLWRLSCSGPVVFPGRQRESGLLSPSAVLLMFWQVQRGAGVVDSAGEPKYVFHALRHFYASIMIALGCNHKWLQKAMGHEKIEMTLGTYGHLFPDEASDRERVAAFDEVVLRGAAMTPFRAAAPALITTQSRHSS